MKTLKDELQYFLSNKVYSGLLLLVAVCAYGFKIAHVDIGIDDTCIPLYFEDGLAPAVGRWTLYLLGKLFHIGDYIPWMTELIGVLCLLFSATLWCVLLLRIFGKKKSILSYAFFAAVFISCPLICEVYTYYLHNGIGIGYGLVAISLLLVLEAVKCKRTVGECSKYAVGTAVLLTVALGCYESFAMVYAIGGVLVFLFVRMVDRRETDPIYTSNIWKWAVILITPMFASLLLRTLAVRIVCTIFGISIPEGFFVKARSSFSVFGESVPELFMYFKRFWVKFYLNGFVYLPIAVLVFGVFTLLIIAVIYGVKKRDVLLPIAAIAIPIFPALMILVEGKESYYRASQYVPLIGACAIFLLLHIMEQRNWKNWRCVSIFLISALLWNQCMDMNNWFYLDYLKYEDTKEVLSHVAYDLNHGDYDTSKPVVFRGAYEVPYGIAQKAYISFESEEYRIMRSIGDLIDVHLVEKFHAGDGNGYVFAETPIISTLQWGVTAFDGTSREIKNFMNMHGVEILIETNLDKIEEAEKKRTDMPGYPRDGYIREFEDYIIINF